ncbi:hypothetical protein Btru_048482 [Bulinus truncatus]|nr:hypothetical protein Btru_048482 [Bulinus truncatus]
MPTEMTYTMPTEITQTMPTEMTYTMPTEMTQTMPTEMTQTIPSEMTHTMPTEMTHTMPTELTHTIPTELTHTMPTEMTHTMPTEMTHTMPTEMTHTLPTEMTHTMPTEMTHTMPTEMTHTLPTEMTHTLPTEMTHTMPTEMTHTIPTELTHTMPTELTHTMPTEMTHTMPTEMTHTMLTELTHTIPTEMTYTMPTELTHTLPTEMTHTMPTEMTHTMPTEMTHTMPTELTHTLPITSTVDMVLLELSVFRLFGILNRMRLLICILLFLENATAQNVYHFDRNVDNDVLNQQYSKPNSVPTFAFAKHFQSHMVLQQAPNSANIYGFSAEIGQTINMQVIVQPSLILYHYKTTSQQGPESGVYVWNLLLDPFPGNTAVDIYVQSEDGSLALNDILFGDVWVCSGQSNMQFTVIQMYDAEKEMDEARFYPNIRLMTVKMNEASTPLYDFLELEQSWTAPNRSTVGGPAGTYFSAVCWLYGKAIHKARGYPIGLVATDYGGTPAEAWSSPEALAACGNLDRSSKENSEYYNKANQPEIFKYKFQNPSDNSVLWNAMIHPLLGMTIYGVLWYQGESDAYGPPRDKYNCTFPTMIKDWRYNFNKFSNGQTRSDFPFGFVQLSAKAADPSILVGFPDIRWHQTADYGYVPNPDMPKNTFVVQDSFSYFKMFSSRPPCHVGDPVCQIETPALVVCLKKLEENLNTMKEAMKIYPNVKLRPHAKTHKCPTLGRLQIKLGAVGLCCQKLTEAEAMVQAGIENILLSNQ